jgi:steroid delta-isomerase-like uncharacterized protein
VNRIDMTTEQQLLREKRDSVVMKHVEAENRHDFDAAIATFHAPRYQVMPMGMVYDGEQAVGELLSGMFKGFPDFTVEIIKTYHSDDAVTLEVRMKGTHLGDWAGLKPTGRVMNIPVACIFEFDKDQLIGEKVYFDMATLMNQLSTAANK